MSTIGAVSAATREAREVGEEVLRAGGNAFDAIVASAIALAVTEPGNCGLGGEGYCVLYDACDQQTGALCFMIEPGSLSAPENLVGKDLRRGPAASQVPGAVAGWFALIAEKCSRSAEGLIAPAVGLAEDGFAIDDHMAGALNWMADQFHPSARAIFVRPDRPWRGGDRLRQRELAQTLRALADGGEQAFYQGDFAERLDTFFRDNGGLVTKGDLAAYRPYWQGTFSRRFGDDEIHVPPPEGAGFSVVYGLELLERLGYGSMDAGGLAATQALVAVLREMDRCVDGIAGRLAPYEAEVEKEVAALFDDDRLAEVVRHLGSHFPGSGARRGTHTTSLSAVDREGSLVCLTQTLDHGFGSGVVIPGTGVLMNNGMAWLNTDPSTDRADLVRPHRRTFVPVVPVLALSKADRPQVALGTPGGNGIPQTTLQVCANLLFRGDDLQTAIGRPRLTVGIIVPELGSAEDIQLEAGFAPEVYEALRKPEMDTGYRNFGRFHAVQRACDGRAVAVDDSRQ